ncbi:hypothetical protein [Imhoffiella purpurea]|uniref:Uncharacterized protein n=1 Tax=Imhoffiella purpurea TaxID=1249627 RepID=W9VZT8_9GAMM|nr:hypothetical protein [Imhoffiella purpurea]EXJ15870.1 hypothetical protein D779_0952 [Imhoffiella purpurea]
MPPHDATPSPIWPSAEYDRQVERLRGAIGQPVHLVEIEVSATHLHIRQLGQSFVLLGLIDFPRPDPSRGLAPHLIILDDGRGVNLGRIARISLERAFNPAPSQILYRDSEALEGLLYRERRLSHDFIAERAHRIMGEMLGYGRIEAISGPGHRARIAMPEHATSQDEPTTGAAD